VIRYARAPSSAFQRLLAPGGLLAPLLETRGVGELRLDVHLREDDHLNVYCGGTCIVDANLSRRKVHVKADLAYGRQACAAALFRTWALDEPGFANALDHYYSNVVVGPRWIKGEGAIQVDWAAVRDPWVPFDREATLGYGTAEHPFRRKAEAILEAAMAEVETRHTKAWTRPKMRTGEGLDQLGVDADGRLVLIELKDATAKLRRSVYDAPLQLLRYVLHWVHAYDEVRAGLDAVREARIALGLSPASMPRLSNGVRAVICFGEAPTPRVRECFDIAHAVVNRHLPPGVAPIEVWAMADGQPRRVG